MEHLCTCNCASSWIETSSLFVAMLGASAAMVFGGKQILLLRKQTQASISDTLMARLQSINELMISNPTLDAALDQASMNLTPELSRAASRIMNIRLNLYDVVFWYHTSNLIQGTEVTAWERTIARNMRDAFARSHWERVKTEYEPAFQAFIDKILTSPERS